MTDQQAMAGSGGNTGRPTNILDRIVEEKRREVAVLPARTISETLLRSAVQTRGGTRDFLDALRRPRLGDVGLIAEVKKASPSAGVICPNFDPVAIARAYEAAGASCLSVLTDRPFFQGSLEYLRAIRAAVSLPLLRKDFIIDDRQLLEAIEWGADAILLIVAILDDTTLRRLLRLGRAAGLAVLVEVHDEVELDRAVAAEADLIGVNNRDLKSFKVDVGTTERLARRLWGPSGDSAPAQSVLLVAESGLHTGEDVARVRRAGARAILVGEALMRDGNLPVKTRQMLGLALDAPISR